MWKVGVGVAVLTLIIDRVLKQMALSFFGGVALHVNERYFFWIEVGAPFSQWLSVLFLCLSIAVLFFLWQNFDGMHKKNSFAAAVLFLGGGASNVVDRLLYGGAVDMIPLFLISYFNISDAALLFGASIFIFMVWHQKYTRERS